jgi:hypothetical protein
VVALRLVWTDATSLLVSVIATVRLNLWLRRR